MGPPFTVADALNKTWGVKTIAGMGRKKELIQSPWEPTHLQAAGILLHLSTTAVPSSQQLSSSSVLELVWTRWQWGGRAESESRFYGDTLTKYLAT